MKTQVTHNGKVIGEVYLSSHGVWVAQPNFTNFSKSFLTKEKAIAELIAYVQNY